MKQEENLYTPRSIRTVSGNYVNVFEPDTKSICIEDIAHALSMQPRFGGHLPEFYSVASHCLMCSYLIENDEERLAALLHDASEAYLLDIPRPIKQELTNYKEIETRLMRLIANKFGFRWPLHKDVKAVDEQVLNLEWDGLMLGKFCFPKSKDRSEVKTAFLSRFNQLTTNPTRP